MFEQSHSGVDSDHLVVVREVGVNRAIERECSRISIKGFVSLSVVLNSGSSETSDKFVDVSDALHRSKVLSVTDEEYEFANVED